MKTFALNLAVSLPTTREMLFPYSKIYQPAFVECSLCMLGMGSAVSAHQSQKAPYCGHKNGIFFTNVALKIAYFGALTSENVVPAINHCMKHVS